ncbi:MAG: ATP-binding protein [Planctomycetota bacterium]
MRPAGISLLIGNDFAELARAAAEMRRFLAVEEIDERAAYAVDLILEEIVSNAIRHGGLAPEDPPTEVRLAVSPEELDLEISDAGPPFDPTAAAPRLAGPDLATEPVGGLGLGMVRNAARELEYRREGGRNVLRALVTRV